MIKNIGILTLRAVHNPSRIFDDHEETLQSWFGGRPFGAVRVLSIKRTPKMSQHNSVTGIEEERRHSE